MKLPVNKRTRLKSTGTKNPVAVASNFDNKRLYLEQLLKEAWSYKNDKLNFFFNYKNEDQTI